MTNEIAIIVLDKMIDDYDHSCFFSQQARDRCEALQMAIKALSKHSASGKQADKKLFDHGYWILPGEVFIGHNVLNEVLNTIIKSMDTEQRKIDSILTKTDQNDEAIRTDDHIADDSKMVDQFRDSAKKTDFKPGDKFILELGAERKMFDEFEIAGTDLYVKISLLEKLTRYEPEKFEIHNDHTDCIWYHYLDDDDDVPNTCPSTCSQYRDGWNDAMKYIYCDGKGYQPYTRKAK